MTALALEVTVLALLLTEMHNKTKGQLLLIVLDGTLAPIRTLLVLSVLALEVMVLALFLRVLALALFTLVSWTDSTDDTIADVQHAAFNSVVCNICSVQFLCNDLQPV